MRCAVEPYGGFVELHAKGKDTVMKLSYLRYFQTVCKYNNLSRAAEELFISQPTLSHAISDLEEEFGVTLFLRQRKGLHLTEEGRRLLELSTDLICRADALVTEMTALGNREQAVNLGLPPMIGSLVFPDFFRRLRTLHPEISLHITEIGSVSGIPLVSDGTLDAAIISHDGPLPNTFDYVNIRKIPILFYLSIENPAASMPILNYEKIQHLPLVLLNEDSFVTSFVSKCFQQRKLKPNVILHTNNLHAIRNLLDNDSAATFLYEGALRNNEENIVAIPLPDDPEIQISLIWNKNHKRRKDSEQSSVF